MKIKPWLAWVALLPAMLAAQFISMVFVHFWLMFIMSDSGFRTIIVGVMPNVVSSAAALATVQSIAPSHKKEVVFGFAALSLLIIGMNITHDLSHAEAGWSNFYGPALGAILGTIGAAYVAIVKDESIINA